MEKFNALLDNANSILAEFEKFKEMINSIPVHEMKEAAKETEQSEEEMPDY